MEGKEEMHLEMLSFCHLVRSVDFKILSIPNRPLLVFYLWLEIYEPNP